MTTQLKQHIETNLDTINAWLGIRAALQVGDITKPIFDEYTETTGFSTTACNDCKLDALLWAKLEYNKSIKKIDNEQSKKTNS